MSGSAPAFHPVFAVTSIKDFIPLILDEEKGQEYALWVELFRSHACAYDVLDHIDASTPRPLSVDASTWNRIDAIVKQWIYLTISKDLLQTITKPGATAQELWRRLEENFRDGKHKHVVRVKNFYTMSDYFKYVKDVADQLGRFENPISEEKLLLQLISSLSEGKYDNIVTRIQNADPLPSFDNAQSVLVAEENLVDIYKTERMARDRLAQALVRPRSDFYKNLSFFTIISMSKDTNPSSSNTSHPAFTVGNNIKSFIPILLDQKEGQEYAIWAELFHSQACAYNVLDHIDPSVPRPPLVDDSTWNRIDGIVKQWIYGTISKDLLRTIIKPRATAQELWTRLEEIFDDGKNRPVMYPILQFRTDPSDKLFKTERMAPREVKPSGSVCYADSIGQDWTRQNWTGQEGRTGLDETGLDWTEQMSVLCLVEVEVVADGNTSSDELTMVVVVGGCGEHEDGG
ncbi:hypothetical protein OSB04_012244 [Centaurea solstitialis]|uniref:Uncharacterized protein n=1 Tax=Centaurea solstitialis TaxID=347529 RepID=A0AA38WM98_9ASTR|nr:hypothetical protein OSB04_012244 [Centaurea solstitialis]